MVGLLAAGAGVDERDDDGDTPLSIASEAGHASIVAALIEAGAAADEAIDVG